ncbi:THAP domain-containing protein 1-like [Rhipicephalus microplus]|uniref:THAP domain-containing protein 1-like n=1 Tax=Rhipicephalus microplus TaxID=6941 RepID=UPI003F6A93C7
MVVCCVPFCESRQGKTSDVTFHEFPVTEVGEKWSEVISRKGAGNEVWLPNDRSKVCSVHFAPTNYKPGLKIKRLKADAVPSVFPHYPKYMGPPVAKVRRTLKRSNVQEHGPCPRKNE